MYSPKVLLMVDSYSLEYYYLLFVDCMTAGVMHYIAMNCVSVCMWSNTQISQELTKSSTHRRINCDFVLSTCIHVFTITHRRRTCFINIYCMVQWVVLQTNLYGDHTFPKSSSWKILYTIIVNKCLQVWHEKYHMNSVPARNIYSNEYISNVFFSLDFHLLLL